MKKVRVGIIGAGGIVAYGHLPALSETAGVNVEAICDTDRERATSLADQYNIAGVYTRPRTMLQKADLDAVLIAVPNAFHEPLAIDALKAGLHVICEKPPALNAEQATRMLATAKRKKKALFYAFNQRYSDRSQQLKKRMNKSELGDVYYIRAGWTRRRFIPGLGGWFTTKRLSGGGPLIDIGVHILDLALWLCDYPAVSSVSGATFHQLGKSIAREDLGPDGEKKMQVEDLAVAFVRFRDGGVLSLETSFALHMRDTERLYLDLMGTKGGAEWRFPFDPNSDPLALMREEDGRPCDLIPKIVEGQPWQSYADEWREFLRLIRRPERSWEYAAQGVTLMKIVDGIYNSAKTGREVRLR